MRRDRFKIYATLEHAINSYDLLTRPWVNRLFRDVDHGNFVGACLHVEGSNRHWPKNPLNAVVNNSLDLHVLYLFSVPSAGPTANRPNGRS